MGCLALALTWPLLAHWNTHVPGNGADDPPLTWNLWWVQHALLTLGVNPYDSNHLFYPLGINLAFYTLTLLNGLLAIPLQSAFGLVSASNLLLLSSFILSGYGASFLPTTCQAAYNRSLVRSTPPPGGLMLGAFAAGLVYAFSSNKIIYAALASGTSPVHNGSPFTSSHSA